MTDKQKFGIWMGLALIFVTLVFAPYKWDAVAFNVNPDGFADSRESGRLWAPVVSPPSEERVHDKILYGTTKTYRTGTASFALDVGLLALEWFGIVIASAAWVMLSGKPASRDSTAV